MKREYTRQPLKVDEVDDFSFQYALGSRPMIQKDEIRLTTTEVVRGLGCLPLCVCVFLGLSTLDMRIGRNLSACAPRVEEPSLLLI